MIVIRRPRDEGVTPPTPAIFEVETRPNTLVVIPIGGFDKYSDAQFSAAVGELLASIGPHVTGIVVDLQNATNCSSDKLLGPLVVIWNRVRKQHGKMAICGVCLYGREVLRRTRLDTIWPIHLSREEALASV